MEGDQEREWEREGEETKRISALRKLKLVCGVSSLYMKLNQKRSKMSSHKPTLFSVIVLSEEVCIHRCYFLQRSQPRLNVWREKERLQMNLSSSALNSSSCRKLNTGSECVNEHVWVFAVHAIDCASLSSLSPTGRELTPLNGRKHAFVTKVASSLFWV